MRIPVEVTAVVMLVAACGDGGADRDDALREKFELAPLPATPYPADNPFVAERVALGRLLFYDPILSGERDVSCGTCHHPDFAFTDGRQFGAGVSGEGLGPARTLSTSAVSGLPVTESPRNTQTVLNAALANDDNLVPRHEAPLFWDGRAVGLEGQALLPPTSRVEMRGDAFPGTDAEAAAVALDSVLERLRDIPEYVDLFRGAFPDEATEVDIGIRASVVDPSTLGRAIGAYERELVSRDSPFDRYARGDDGAITEQQKLGIELFFEKAKCGFCHRGPMFSTYRFLVVGTPQEGTGKATVPGDDLGRAEHTGLTSDHYRFRVPALRNVELTAPYMHAGVFGTLEEVVEFYNRGALPRHPNVPEERIENILRVPLELTETEVAAIVAFLRALTDPGAEVDPVLLTVPSSVPSGLTPVFGLLQP